jgi:hypothetical protein
LHCYSSLSVIVAGAGVSSSATKRRRDETKTSAGTIPPARRLHQTQRAAAAEEKGMGVSIWNWCESKNQINGKMINNRTKTKDNVGGAAALHTSRHPWRRRRH